MRNQNGTVLAPFRLARIAGALTLIGLLGACGGSSSGTTPGAGLTSGATNSAAVSCNNPYEYPAPYPSPANAIPNLANTMGPSSLFLDQEHKSLVVAVQTPAAKIIDGDIPGILDSNASQKYQAAGLDGTLDDGPILQLADTSGHWLYQLNFTFPGTAHLTANSDSNGSYKNMITQPNSYDATEYSDGNRVLASIPLSKLRGLGTSFLWQFETDNGESEQVCPSNKDNQSIIDIFSTQQASNPNPATGQLSDTILADFGRYPAGRPSTTPTTAPSTTDCTSDELAKSLQASNQASGTTYIRKYACQSGYALADVTDDSGETGTAAFQDRSGRWTLLFIGSSGLSADGIPAPINTQLEGELSGSASVPRSSSACSGQLEGSFTGFSNVPTNGSTGTENLNGTITNHTTSTVYVGGVIIDAYFPASSGPGWSSQAADDKGLQANISSPGSLGSGKSEAWTYQIQYSSAEANASKVTVVGFLDERAQPIPLASVCSDPTP